jgi:uncharacterized protein (DUF2141 family)
VLAVGLLAIASCAKAPPRAPEPRPGGTGRVEVTVTGFRSEEGEARIALYLDEGGWPNEEPVFATAVLPIREGRASTVFEDVPAGPFAVSAFHDKDSDGELDTGFLDIPSEDYGFSADARGTFGPPGFEEARLDLAAGELKQVAIHVK